MVLVTQAWYICRREFAVRSFSMFAKRSMRLNEAKALVARIWMCSLNVRCASNHIPSHLTAFVAGCTTSPDGSER
jgi:hypothetical protein